MIKWKIDSSWTLFLDRDGVINKRKMGGYITTIEEFEFLENVPQAIQNFTNQFGKIIVVTNQQGIAKKIMSKSNLLEIHAYMCMKIEQNGGKIDNCYFAPDLKSEENLLRKPNSGMALLAQSDFPEIDFNKSIMVGDTDSDILFGLNLGMKTVRVKTVEPIGLESHITVESLFEFSEILKNHIK
jgi:histidinol-phosphate phosphatase family protein